MLVVCENPGLRNPIHAEITGVVTDSTRELKR